MNPIYPLCVLSAAVSFGTSGYVLTRPHNTTPDPLVSDLLSTYEGRFGYAPYTIGIVPPGEYAVMQGGAVRLDGTPLDEFEVGDAPFITLDEPVAVMDEHGVGHMLQPHSIFAARARETIRDPGTRTRIPGTPNQDETFRCWVVCSARFAAICDEGKCLCVRIAGEGEGPGGPGVRHSCFIRWPEN